MKSGQQQLQIERAKKIIIFLLAFTLIAYRGTTEMRGAAALSPLIASAILIPMIGPFNDFLQKLELCG
jgi:hypothetical protein